MTGQGAQGSRAERTIRVFLSSTFIDMQAEREELIKRVFPRIASLCRQRHIVFTEVDLRWGISDEQQQEGKVLSICFDEIDRCRPYFIGMLGSRYGYVPTEDPPRFSERFPDLAKDIGKSVTELEITYGVLANPTLMSRSLFLIRRPDAIPVGPDAAALVEAPTRQEIAEMGLNVARQRAAERAARLENLKQRIRASGLPLVDGYSSAEELGEHVLEFLTDAIDEEYPEDDIPDVFEREDATQAALLRSHAPAYFPDGRIEQYLGRVDETFVLTGEPGSGKTALLANWVAGRPATAADADFPRGRRSRGRGASPGSPVLVSAFVGASSESTNWRFILRYLTRSLVRRFRLSTKIPEDGIELVDVFRDCLARAASIHPVILVIDGLDHLWAGDGAHSLFWLPTRIPKNIRVILSAAPGEAVVAAESRGWPTIRVPTLRRQQRAEIVREKLRAYGKTLDESIVAEIAATEGGRSPAFVHILLNEIRLHGDHSSLVPLIRRYLTARTDRELLALMLERWERDYEGGRPALVRETFSLLWASPGGLTEIELADLLDGETEPVPRILLATLLRAAGDLLAERTGRISIAYRALRDAVSERYLGDDDAKAQARLRIARHFAARDYGLRRDEGGAGQSWHDDVIELANLYSSAGAWPALAQLLGDATFLGLACHANRLAVAQHWAAIEANSPIRMRETYRQAIDTPQVFHSARDLAFLLWARDYQQEALKVFDALVEQYRLPSAQFLQTGFSLRIGKFGSAGFADASADWMQQQTLQEILFDRCARLIEVADFEAALADVAEAEQIAERWRDLPSLARCKMHGATIARLQGDQGYAAQILREAIASAREAGAADIFADATSQAGRILFEQGRIEEASKLQEDAIAFCLPRENARELGELYNNLGLICVSLGQTKKALKHQEECERWYRRLEADAPAEHIGRALGNQAELLEALNRPEKAVSRYREAAKWFARADNAELEQAALTQLAARLGKVLDTPHLSGRKHDQTLEEAESVMVRLYRLRSADPDSSPESIAEAGRNAGLVLFRRALRLRDLGQLDEARQRLRQSIAVARAHGIEYVERAAGALDKELREQNPPDEAILACVHCGRTDDASLHLREHQFAPRNRGRQYYFAQCTSCRDRFAGTGYHVLLTVVGSYPEAQLRRALAPGSDELWIA